jgi:succinate dehydrogenase/fumarate reductase flavoprotein subunit
MKNRKYWIDPEVCISCGLCAKNCHNQAISNPDLPKEIPVAHDKVVKSCDVLVIGGGGSGLTAAAKALDLGKSVIVLEKNWETGGSAYFGHMMRVHYSKWHEEQGLEDPREQLYQSFVEKTEGRCNNQLVKRCLEADADLANWLIDVGELQKGFKMGKNRMGFPDLVDNFTCKLNELRSDPSIGPGASGWYITNLLADRIRREGGEILCNTQAVQLLTQGDRVVGVLAKDPGGEVEVHAKAVIMAAGTYSRNRELMDKMQPCFYENFEENPIHIYACSTCTGDGITMCDEIGTDIDYENKRSCIFGPIHHPYSYSVLVVNRYAEASGVLVNREGEFINMQGVPPMTEVGVLNSQPGRIGWLILDQAAWDEAVACGLKSKDGDEQMALSHLERDLAGELKDGSVVFADSVEALAEKLKADPEKIRDAISQHNWQIQNPPPAPPVDPDDFMAQIMANMPKGKEIGCGPYYAIYQGCFKENAIGGMTIDEHTNVLRQGKPIPGLYACGDNTRGIMLPGDIGVAFIEGVLSAMTFAMCSGYVAAEEASVFCDAE